MSKKNDAHNKMIRPNTKRSVIFRAGYMWFRRAVRWVVSLHGQPRDIARGAAIGIFVAFSPTIGLQMILAAVLATLTGSSRAAAVAAVWITNPLTIPPIYATTYYIGAIFWASRQDDVHIYDRLIDLTRKIDGYGFFEIFDRFNQLLAIGYDIIVPMTIGGILVGLAAAAITYPATLWSVQQARHLHLRRSRNSRGKTAARK